MTQLCKNNKTTKTLLPVALNTKWYADMQSGSLCNKQWEFQAFCGCIYISTSGPLGEFLRKLVYSTQKSSRAKAVFLLGEIGTVLRLDTFLFIKSFSENWILYSKSCTTWISASDFCLEICLSWLPRIVQSLLVLNFYHSVHFWSWEIFLVNHLNILPRRSGKHFCLLNSYSLLLIWRILS